MAVERSFTHAKFICFDRCALGGLRPVEDVSGTHWALAGGLWVRNLGGLGPVVCVVPVPPLGFWG